MPTLSERLASILLSMNCERLTLTQQTDIASAARIVALVEREQPEVAWLLKEAGDYGRLPSDRPTWIAAAARAEWYAAHAGALVRLAAAEKRADAAEAKVERARGLKVLYAGFRPAGVEAALTFKRVIRELAAALAGPAQQPAAEKHEDAASLRRRGDDCATMGDLRAQDHYDAAAVLERVAQEAGKP